MAAHEESQHHCEIHAVANLLDPPEIDLAVGEDSFDQCNAQYTDTWQFSDLPSIHSKHRVPVSTIFKTAISLYNIQRTGASHAIFTLFLSGRAWPFLDESLAAFLPSAWTIAGPTLTSVLILDWEETIE